VLEVADVDADAGQHDKIRGTCSTQDDGQAGDRQLVQRGRSRGHDQHPVIQLVAELVVGHVLDVLDGEHPVLAGPETPSGHDLHSALPLP
jgi:hypothetical protein